MPKASRKPAPGKPHKDFPLFPHATGRWAKKVRGKFVYFGKVADDPDGRAALERWLAEKDDLLAGRTPRVHRDGLTMADLANAFLTAKQRRLDSGELARRTFLDYHATCARLIGEFGRDRLVEDLAADDFGKLRAAMAKTWGKVSVSNEVNRIRVVFKFAFDNALVKQQVRFGSEFRRPSAKELRRARHERGSRKFEPAQLRKLLERAPTQLRAMILLGINCALGNADCGRLETRHLGLRRRWLDFPRPKTAVDRRCRLWPETVAAIEAASAQRPASKDAAHAGLVFLTRTGAPWHRDEGGSPISAEFTKLLAETGIRRSGLSFYSLRHTFETIAGGTKDQIAVDYIMGHAPPSSDMAARYREEIEDERLQAVTDHVHAWLYAPEAKAKGMVKFASTATPPARKKQARKKSAVR